MEDRFRYMRTEAANRAEAIALLIRCGYKVYQPEVDADGEDLVVRTPSGELRAVQLKGRPTVDLKRYDKGDIWMSFPSAIYTPSSSRVWFLIPHNYLYDWVKGRHGHTRGSSEQWSYPSTSKDLRSFLAEWVLGTPSELLSGSETST